MTTEIEAEIAAMRVATDVMLVQLSNDNAHLRDSHDALLAAAKEALDYLARGKVDRVDDVLRASIANAEKLP